MSRPHLAFVDWMKAVGMGLIVFGHTGSGSIIRPTDPINLKQLGVALFVFATGFTLAREDRSVRCVLFNRLFEVCLFGWFFAVVLSVINYLRIGDINESNYLPLLFGANVLFNSFPANPTTWYIGTYFHLLLLWAVVFRRLEIRFWMILGCLAIDMLIRAALMSCAGDYVAYQLATNWMTLLLLGLWAGGRQKQVKASWYAAIPLAMQVVATFAWMTVIRGCEFTAGNPFMHSHSASHVCRSTMFISVCVGVLYVGHTWMFFETARRLPSVPVIRFLARNTLVIFIIHMPLIYALNPSISPLFAGKPWLRVIINMAVYFFGIALFSELLRRVVRARELRNAVAARLEAVGALA